MHKGDTTLKILVRSYYLLFAMLLLCCIPYNASAYNRDPVQQAVNRAVDTVKPSLVRIHVVAVEDRDGREIKEEAYGSGVIISSDGYVITNHHVAGHAKLLTCTMPDRTEIDAKLIGTDAFTDIAVIRLTPVDKQTFPAAAFGDSSKLRVGDAVLAMGCPLALSQSVTKGVVSNTEVIAPSIMGGGLSLDGEEVGALVRWIGHDAEIHPGNSGGPLVNLKGQIVGINEIEMGLGGAIPGNLARQIAMKLISDGRIRRSWMGFGSQPLLRSGQIRQGVLVSSVVNGSPAEKAGLQPGDVITKLAGTNVTVRFAEERPVFNQLCMGLEIAKPVEMVVMRGTKEINLTITPVERPSARARAVEIREWGITASDITLLAASESKRDRSSGALVTSVRPGGPAGEARPEIAPGDVIIGVDGKTVANVTDLKKITGELTDKKNEPVAVLVSFERGDRQFVTIAHVGIKETKDPGLEVAKAWLPVSTQVLTSEIAKALGIPDSTGVRITQVYLKTAAEKAGFKVGDVITAVDGNPVSASQAEDTEVFPAMIRQYQIGSKAEFSVFRDGKEMTISSELPQSPKLPREMKKYQNDDFDLSVRDIAFLDRVEQKWDDSQKGVLVEGIGQGGWAALGGLLAGDLIIAVDGAPIKDVIDFQQRMEKITAKKAKAMIFQVQRGIGKRYLEISPAWSGS